MSIINFTVQFDVLTNREDGSDAGLDTDIVALTGPVVFTPLVVNDNKLALVSGFSPRPAGIKLRPQSGWIGGDGRLKDRPFGNAGVRLWANDPQLGLNDPLVYRVDFDLTTTLGKKISIDPGFFEAPSTDTTIQLANVLEPVVSLAVGASPLAGGSFVGDTVVFATADGVSLSPIEIPEGFLVFVDNGDSTWSVGVEAGS